MLPDLLVTFVWFLIALVAAGGLSAYLIASRAARKVASLRPRRAAPHLTARPPQLVVEEEGADLLAYPRKLEALERRLAERQRAVQDQMQLVGDRGAEMQAKGGRDELVGKYRQDLALLDARAASMRRVLGMVWKTRAVLLFRAHLAISARRRPDLGPMPDPQAPDLDLRSAQQAFHAAAAAVKFYLDVLKQRAEDLPSIRPELPLSAEADVEMHALVDVEQERTAAAYTALMDDMDRLCDNLTWLGDHFASKATLDGADAGPETASPDSGPLLEAVDRALRDLSGLARSMDPVMADGAVEHLAEDIGRLEEAGLEADAEARAQLEVDRLLAPPPESRP